jgi:hypothetical protein
MSIKLGDRIDETPSGAVIHGLRRFGPAQRAFSGAIFSSSGWTDEATLSDEPTADPMEGGYRPLLRVS